MRSSRSPDGTGQQQITSTGGTVLLGCNPENEFCGPGNAPDGLQIAYTTSGPPIRTFIISKATGRGPRQIGIDADQNPAWNTKGTKLVVESPSGLAIIDVNTRQRTLINGTQLGDASPQWKPDGTEIAFGRKVGGISNIFTISTAGGVAVQRTTGCPAAGSFPGCFQPTYSPNATTIALTFGPGSGGTPGAYAIGTIPANAVLTAPVALANSALAGTADVHPSYSPDGTQIVAQETVTNTLVILGANGVGRTPLTNGGTETAPSWRN